MHNEESLHGTLIPTSMEFRPSKLSRILVADTQQQGITVGVSLFVLMPMDKAPNGRRCNEVKNPCSMSKICMPSPEFRTHIHTQMVHKLCPETKQGDKQCTLQAKHAFKKLLNYAKHYIQLGIRATEMHVCQHKSPSKHGANISCPARLAPSTCWVSTFGTRRATLRLCCLALCTRRGYFSHCMNQRMVEHTANSSSTAATCEALLHAQ